VIGWLQHAVAWAATTSTAQIDEENEMKMAGTFKHSPARGRRRHRTARLVLASTVLLSACAGAACGFGVYDDTGSPEPSGWWPWACPDGGAPTPESGCLPPNADGSSQ
jgi:hypothetical protein